MKLQKTLLGLTIGSAILAMSLTTAQARELRLAHGMTVDNAQHIGLQAFADEVAKLSNGELTVTIYPNGQLGGERETAEQTVTGALDMCKINGSLAETFEPKYGIMSIPFMFRDYEQAKAFMLSDLPEKYFFHSSKDRGVIGLMLIAAGSRSFYANKAIDKPEDLSGLKMRVPESDMSMRMVRAMGGQPTPVPWSEIYSALQQKIVDGAENSISSFVEQRHCEVNKYYSFDEHTMTPDVVLISDLTWETLSPEEQDIIKKAAKVGTQTSITAWDENDAKNLQKAKDMGIHLSYPDKQPFRDKTKFILDEEMQKDGYKEIIEAIQKL